MSNWQSVCVFLSILFVYLCEVYCFVSRQVFTFIWFWLMTAAWYLCINERTRGGVRERATSISSGFRQTKEPVWNSENAPVFSLFIWLFNISPKGILVEIIHICGPIPDSTGIYEINSRRKFFSRFRILIYLLFIIFSSWGGKYIMCFYQIFNSPQKKLPKTYHNMFGVNLFYIRLSRSRYIIPSDYLAA